MSDAIAGVGTILKRGDGASNETFTAIAEVRRIGGPSMSRDQIEVTNLDSVGGWKEYITGFRDGGELVCTINFTRASFDSLWEDFNNDDARNYRIYFPDDDNTMMEFAARITQLPFAIEPADAITYDVTFKIDGAPTVDSGS